MHFLIFFIVICFVAYIVQIKVLKSLIDNNFSDSTALSVSIIKPLKGLDDNLFDNIESFCNLNYTAYELILCLSSCADPAYKVAKKIKEKYPNRDISIVINDSMFGLNPKINNMFKAYTKAKYDLIIISDSNVFVGKDYINNTLKYLKNEQISVVTNLIRGKNAKNLGSLLENLQLNTFVVCGMAFLNTKTSIPCVVGKSILFRKKDLEESGGFWVIKDYLAEDFMIGKLAKDKNKKVALSNYFVDNINEYWSIKGFLNRHTRWAKMRYKIGGIKYASEILSNPVFIAFIGLIAFGFSKLALEVFLIVLITKALLDWYVGYLINADIKMFYYFLSPIKDLIIGIVWFVPFFSSKVYWRGKKYSIAKNTLLIESR